MIRMGVICPSEIAFRRFMPAISQDKDFQFVGIGVCRETELWGHDNMSGEEIKNILVQERRKAEAFINVYGGKIYDGYSQIIESKEIDALYIPLPPALHYKWAKMALTNNLHVLVEKPATTLQNNTEELVKTAQDRSLALHENYMFIFHQQLEAINNIIHDGTVGDVRLYRICFGFPQRQKNDFRYKKDLGGGALIDAGGYVLKYAHMLLGESAKITAAQLNYIEGYEVDMYGSATIVNRYGDTAQIAFGMDNSYKCELEVWGSKGCLLTGRILTAPAGFVPEIEIKTAEGTRKQNLPSDDAFLKSIQHFKKCIQTNHVRTNNYQNILKQAGLVESFLSIARNTR